MAEILTERNDASLVAARALGRGSNFSRSARFLRGRGARGFSGGCRGKTLGFMARTKDALSLQDQIPTAGHAELRKQGRHMELHSAKGNVQAFSDLLIDAVAHDFVENFMFSGAEGHGRGI